MKIKNDFTDETKALFVFVDTCWRCDRPNPEPHHILKRVSNSPLNLYPLCRTCHSKHTEMMSEPNKKKFLNETIRFLAKSGYKWKEKDLEFYINNRKYYD